MGETSSFLQFLQDDTIETPESGKSSTQNKKEYIGREKGAYYLEIPHICCQNVRKNGKSRKCRLPFFEEKAAACYTNV
jgi:hypothetical protein